jgi:stage IV sporulation protein FB
LFEQIDISHGTAPVCKLCLECQFKSSRVRENEDMFLVEPQPTPADLKFRLLGIPVRVSPWFWAMGFVLGMGGGGSVKPVDMFAWIAAIFVAITLHEMGHALTARHFGHRVWITLYGMGGLASHQGSDDSVSTKVKITAAGPGIGFIAAALQLAVYVAMGSKLRFLWMVVPYAEVPVELPPFFDKFLYYLLFVNLVWGLFNLLPIYPLDGGQIVRALWENYNPWDGLRKSLIVSIMVCIFMALLSLMRRDTYLVFFLAYLAYINYQELMNRSQNDRYGSRW